MSHLHASWSPLGAVTPQPPWQPGHGIYGYSLRSGLPQQHQVKILTGVSQWTAAENIWVGEDLQALGGSTQEIQPGHRAVAALFRKIFQICQRVVKAYLQSFCDFTLLPLHSMTLWCSSCYMKGKKSQSTLSTVHAFLICLVNLIWTSSVLLCVHPLQLLPSAFSLGISSSSPYPQSPMALSISRRLFCCSLLLSKLQVKLRICFSFCINNLSRHFSEIFINFFWILI